MIYQIDPHDIPKHTHDEWESLLNEFNSHPIYAPSNWIPYAVDVGEWITIETYQGKDRLFTAQRLYPDHQPLTLNLLKELKLKKIVLGETNEH